MRTKTSSELTEDYVKSNNAENVPTRIKEEILTEDEFIARLGGVTPDPFVKDAALDITM